MTAGPTSAGRTGRVGASLAAPRAKRVWQSPLWRKQAAVMASLCAFLIAVLGGLELRASFDSARLQASRLQAAQAGEAAFALGAALMDIDRYVAAVNQLPWQRNFLGADTRREEFARLLRLVPAAESIAYLDGSGHELLNVSRFDVDRTARVADLAALQAQPALPLPVHGRVVQGQAAQPVVDFVRPDTGAGGGSTVVRIGLQALARSLRNALTLDGAEVYVVDANGVLALHRDALLVLGRDQLPRLPGEPDASAVGTGVGLGTGASAALARAASAWTQPLVLSPAASAATATAATAPTTAPTTTAAVASTASAASTTPTAPARPVPVPLSPAPPSPPAAAADTTPPDAAEPTAQPGRSRQGEAVFRTVVPIPELGWRMVVERPAAAVMAPVWDTVRRIGLVLALGVVLSLAVSLLLASRMTRPMRLLHGAAGRLAAGHLDTRIAIRTGDELQDLAGQFNDMAARLGESVTQLEARIDERTRELQRANRHKSDFLANMSHEVGTPLNAILGFADVLDQHMAGPLNAKQRDYVGDIRASAEHLRAMLNDVLDASRIDGGGLQLEYSEFVVAATMAAAATQVRERSLQKQQTLTITLAPDLATWFADERRVKQVLLNLLSNAVKFTPPGGSIALRAGVVRADDAAGMADTADMADMADTANTGVDGDSITSKLCAPQLGDRLWFEVQDNGVGIAPADHAAVFEQFRQAGDAGSRAQGTGLGLSLVRAMVQAHGGTVTLHSALGEGALFRVELPLPAHAPALIQD